MYGEEVQGTQSEKYIKRRSEGKCISHDGLGDSSLYLRTTSTASAAGPHISTENSQIRLAPSVMQQGSSQSEARASKDEKQECPGVSPDASWPL